jgi:hypothetical protein
VENSRGAERVSVLLTQGFSGYTQTDSSPSGQVQLYLVAPAAARPRSTVNVFSKLLKSLLSKAKRGLREIWMVGFIFAQIKLKVNVNSYVSLYDCLSVHSFIKLKSCMEGH